MLCLQPSQVSAPSLSMPELGKMKQPKKKVFRASNYIIVAHLNDKCSYRRSGKTFAFTMESTSLYYDDGETEEKKNYRFEWVAPNNDQADSWEATIKGNGNGVKAL